MGDGIAGGQVIAQWPGLAPGHLVAVTIDFREVLAELLAHRMGATNLGAIVPGSTPTTVGVTI